MSPKPPANIRNWFRTVLWLAFVQLPFLVAGCLPTGGGGGSSVTAAIQNVEVECPVDSAPACNSSGKTIRVGLSADQEVNCESFIQSLNGTPFALGFDASGSTTSSFDGLAVRATVSAWVGDLGQSVGTLERRQYRVCAHLDSDGDSLLDVGEPVGVGYLTPGGAAVDLTDWFAHFFL